MAGSNLGTYLRSGVRWAFIAVLGMALIGFLRSLFDPSSQGYRDSHLAIDGGWTGILEAPEQARPERDPFFSEQAYRNALQQWATQRQAASSDRRGVYLNLHPSQFTLGSPKLTGTVRMCAPNGAEVSFAFDTVSMADQDLTVILTLPSRSEMGNLVVHSEGNKALASYDVFGSKIGGSLKRGDETAYRQVCAQVAAEGMKPKP